MYVTTEDAVVKFCLRHKRIHKITVKSCESKKHRKLLELTNVKDNISVCDLTLNLVYL